MRVTLISCGAGTFTPEPPLRTAIETAIVNGKSPGEVLADYEGPEGTFGIGEHAVVTDDAGGFLWTGQVDYQPPGAPVIRPVAWRVTRWDGHRCPDALDHSLTVTEEDDGLYAVRAGGTGPMTVLDADGQLRHDDPADPRLRFPLDEALRIAQAAAPGLVRHGKTAAEALAWHQEHGCPYAPQPGHGVPG